MMPSITVYRNDDLQYEVRISVHPARVASIVFDINNPTPANEQADTWGRASVDLYVKGEYAAYSVYGFSNIVKYHKGDFRKWYAKVRRDRLKMIERNIDRLRTEIDDLQKQRELYQ